MATFVGDPLSKNRKLANLILVWTAVSSSCQKSGTSFRAFADSIPRIACHRKHQHQHRQQHRHRHKSSPSSALLAFVWHPEREIAYNCLCQRARTESNYFGRYKTSYQRANLTLGAGRERRVSSNSSSSSSSTDPQYAQEQLKLIEQEEAARQKRLNEMDQRIQKLARREERIFVLEEKLALEKEGDSTVPNEEYIVGMTDVEKAELEGLKKVQQNFEEQYNPQEFSEEHMEFKALHNDVFCRLVRWCEENVRENEATTNEPSHPILTRPTNVFFLDGPDGGTAASLIQMGNFAPSQCYVANRHASTCVALRESGGGLLPEENVFHATCSEALTQGTHDEAKQGAFGDVDFTGYYFDGCSGYAPHIVNMMSSALLVLDDDFKDNSSNEDKKDNPNKDGPRHPIVVGYSLLGGTKNLVEKELEVSRAMTIIARSRGMRIVQALEDPLRFGLSGNVPKLGGKQGTTFTTWLVLEPE